MSGEATSNVPAGAQIFPAIFVGTSQKVAIGASSVQSTAVGAGTSVVEVCSDQDCFIAIGQNPTAVANTSCFLPAKTKRLYGCNGGDKVAVIQSVSAGNLYITEGA